MWKGEVGAGNGLQDALAARDRIADDTLFVFQEEEQVKLLGFFCQAGQGGDGLLHMPVVVGVAAGV